MVATSDMEVKMIVVTLGDPRCWDGNPPGHSGGQHSQRSQKDLVGSDLVLMCVPSDLPVQAVECYKVVANYPTVVCYLSVGNRLVLG